MNQPPLSRGHKAEEGWSRGLHWPQWQSPCFQLKQVMVTGMKQEGGGGVILYWPIPLIRKKTKQSNTNSPRVGRRSPQWQPQAQQGRWELRTWHTVDRKEGSRPAKLQPCYSHMIYTENLHRMHHWYVAKLCEECSVTSYLGGRLQQKSRVCIKLLLCLVI